MTTISRSLGTFSPSAPAFGLSDPEHVEQPAVREQGQSGDEHVRNDQPGLAPGRVGQAAENPGVDRLERLCVSLLEVGLGGGEERRDRDPGQQYGGRARRAARRGILAAPASACAERVRKGDGRDAAAKCGDGKQIETAAADDYRGGPQAGAGGDSEQVGVGQRVAKHALVGGTAAGQHRPRPGRRAGPWAA